MMKSIESRWVEVSDEFIRHKVLDFMGDISLSGYRILGSSLHHTVATVLTQNCLIRFSNQKVIGNSFVQTNLNKSFKKIKLY